MAVLAVEKAAGGEVVVEEEEEKESEEVVEDGDDFDDEEDDLWRYNNYDDVVVGEEAGFVPGADMGSNCTTRCINNMLHDKQRKGESLVDFEPTLKT